MAFPGIVSELVSTALQAGSLVWMELAMFAAAGVLYLIFTGIPPIGNRISKRVFVAHGGCSTSKSCSETAGPDGELSGQGDHAAVLRNWEKEKKSEQAPKCDLASVVDAMRKLGKTNSDVIAELRSALQANPALLPSVEGLLSALVKDDAAELLQAAIVLLEENGRSPDKFAYAGLMGALLRRRDFAGVASVAARVPSESMTPKMRAILATAAAQRGRLDEALGHVRQMPAPEDGARSALTPVAAAHVLGLAAKEGRVPAATEELVRVRVRLESRHLDAIIRAEGRNTGVTDKGGAATTRWDLLDAATALKVPRSPGFYQALAATLAADADGPGLRAVVQELEADKAGGNGDGTILTEALALALLDACRVVKANDVALRIFELHRGACAGAPGAKVLSATCSALVACDRTTPACDFYEQEMVPKGVWPDASLTGALLKAAAQAGRSTLAKKLADHAATQSARGGSGSGGSGSSEIQRQATMIKAFARDRNLSGAKGVFERLRSSGATMSPLIYNCLLDALVHCGDHEGAQSHFEEMKRLNFLDVVGYNTMLKAYLARGRTEDARALVEEMTSRGLSASKVTYNELLHSKVLAKDLRGIWSVIDDMHAANVRVNSVTCSILLKALTLQSSASDVKRVTDLIDEVEEPIDEVLFSSVIEACIRICQLDLLSDLMRRYRQKGSFVNLTAPTYGSMIKAYGQAGDVVRVRELWNEMEERGVKPTSITLGCMTEALVTNNQADEAWQLVHTQLQSEERQGCINTVIYSTVLKGFAVTRRIDKVFSVYREMRSRSIACNTITYNTMLDACAKCCAMDRASALLEDMKDAAIEPDIITYSTIVKGYCVEGDVDRAFHVLEEMKSDDKFAADEIMYNSILDGCAKQHRVEDALRVLDEMKSAGIGPSNYTLSILVKLLGHARRLGQAFRMVDDLSKQNGFRPNVQVYTCLVQACVLNRRLEKALALHDTMVADACCRVDEKFYAVLARGCLQMHQPMKAVEVVRAAYKLPGHSLAEPARPTAHPIGVESRALEEVALKLQAGGQEEQDALAALSAELLEKHGVRINEGGGYGGSRRAGGGGGDSRRRRGGANRSAGK